MSRVVISDPARCRGCLSCMVVCATVNEGMGDLNAARIRITPFWSEAFFVQSVCLQCEIPHCSLVCPVFALKKDPATGVVVLDRRACIGCKLCLIGCPFGNMTFAGGTAAKCETCGGAPACVQVCQWGALRFGESDEIGASKRERLAARVRDAYRQSPTV